MATLEEQISGMSDFELADFYNEKKGQVKGHEPDCRCGDCTTLSLYAYEILQRWLYEQSPNFGRKE